MTIVDQQHAAEVVTAKGKGFKFDAIECMVNYLDKQEDKNTPFCWYQRLRKPGEWIPVEASYYLISPAIPQPDGRLSVGFRNPAAGTGRYNRKKGGYFDWKGLRAYMKK